MQALWSQNLNCLTKLIANAERVAYHGLPKYTFYRHDNNNSAWTTNHSLFTPEILDEYLESYVVINLSPLVIRKNTAVLIAYQGLIDEIIAKTDMNIALVPHVEVSVDNDCNALAQLNGPENRIFRIPAGLSAAEYKYIISKAEFCVAARTHATIAAWSSSVPTIAVGYSAKSRGIAGDLGQEQYVVDINSIDNNILCSAFDRLVSEKHNIQNVISERAAECIERVKNAVNLLLTEDN